MGENANEAIAGHSKHNKEETRQSGGSAHPAPISQTGSQSTREKRKPGDHVTKGQRIPYRPGHQRGLQKKTREKFLVEPITSSSCLET